MSLQLLVISIAGEFPQIAQDAIAAGFKVQVHRKVYGDRGQHVELYWEAEMTEEQHTTFIEWGQP